jgi:hypothetical protein
MLMTGVLAMWLVMCVPLFFFPGCPCCGSETNCFSCDDSLEMIDCWEVTIAGVTDGTCSECELVNGTWILSYVVDIANQCTWDGDAIDNSGAGCSNIDFWRLVFTSGEWRVRLGQGVLTQLVRYTGLDETNFDCDGPNVLSVFGTPSGVCANFPATVTVTPCE